MIRFETLKRKGPQFMLQSVYLNPSWIVRVHENQNMTKDFQCEQTKKKFPEGLDHRHTLSDIVYVIGTSTESIIVVGSPELIYNKINGNKNLLRG